MNTLSSRPQNKDFGKRIAHITSERVKSEATARAVIYESNPKHCTHCSTFIPYKQRHNKFCSKHCSGMHNNQNRVLTDDHKNRTSESLRAYHEARPKKVKPATNGRKRRLLACDPGFVWKSAYPFSRVRPCKECNKFMQNYHKMYCDDCYPNIAQYRSRCQFQFNMYDYPAEFSLQLIEEHGWYSPGGNRGRNKNRNMTGVSRDHRFSVNDGFKAKIDPALLSHPVNCQLLLHDENNRKNTHSSISITELIQLISQWDEKYDGVAERNRTPVILSLQPSA